MKEIIISGNEANQRLDKFLAKLLNKAPKSFYYKMLRKKTIVLNGKKASGSEKLKEGDAVKLFLAEDTFLKFTSQKQALHTGVKLDILYEDDHVIMINKPAGMLSQKSRDGDISLVEHLISYLLETGAVTEAELATFSPSVCNRLDRNTSGLVTAGKSMIGLQTLSGWFRDRTVRKYYRCLVKGQVSESQKAAGYLKKDRQNNQVEISERPISDSRIETEYRPIRTGKEATLLEVHLITGRTHQIRAHLAYLGHPVIGDPKYGDERTNQTYREKYRLKTQLLHAYRLEIPEVEGPLSYLSGREFLAPVPRLFREICEKQEVM